jgi:hypothetical protein
MVFRIKSMNKKVYFFFFILFLASGLFYFCQTNKKQNSNLKDLERHITKYLEEGKHTWDLRELNQNEWDSLALIKPYQSLCDLGISGFTKDTPNCLSNLSDSHVIFVFFKENQMSTHFDIERSLADFSTLQVSGLIPREKALFKILHLTPKEPHSFPKVILMQDSEQ